MELCTSKQERLNGMLVELKWTRVYLAYKPRKLQIGPYI